MRIQFQYCMLSVTPRLKVVQKSDLIFQFDMTALLQTHSLERRGHSTSFVPDVFCTGKINADVLILLLIFCRSEQSHKNYGILKFICVHSMVFHSYGSSAFDWTI